MLKFLTIWIIKVARRNIHDFIFFFLDCSWHIMSPVTSWTRIVVVLLLYDYQQLGTTSQCCFSTVLLLSQAEFAFEFLWAHCVRWFEFLSSLIIEKSFLINLGLISCYFEYLLEAFCLYLGYFVWYSTFLL